MLSCFFIFQVVFFMFAFYFYIFPLLLFFIVIIFIINFVVVVVSPVYFICFLYSFIIAVPTTLQSSGSRTLIPDIISYNVVHDTFQLFLFYCFCPYLSIPSPHPLSLFLHTLHDSLCITLLFTAPTDHSLNIKI